MWWEKKGADASLAKEEWDIEMNVSPKTSYLQHHHQKQQRRDERE
jgi:hypothetical protein